MRIARVVVVAAALASLPATAGLGQAPAATYPYDHIHLNVPDPAAGATRLWSQTAENRSSNRWPRGALLLVRSRAGRAAGPGRSSANAFRKILPLCARAARLCG